MTKRIVLIDDDNQTNFLNKFIIEGSSLVDEVITYVSPLSALDYLNKRSDEEKGSLILLDINMPVMDGWEFLKHYATQNNNTKVDTVVMLTSSIEKSDERKAEANEIVSGLAFKPLSLRVIHDLIKTHLK